MIWRVAGFILFVLALALLLMQLAPEPRQQLALAAQTGDLALVFWAGFCILLALVFGILGLALTLTPQQ